MKITLRCILYIVLTCSVFASDKWVVGADGIGPAKIGMTLPQLNISLHEQFKLPTATDERGCFYVNPKGHPHVAFMIEDGRLSRIDVDAPGIADDSGIQIGDPESRVRKVYADRVTTEPHKYVDEGHYLTVRSKDGRHSIRFETDGKKVTSFYFGTHQAIQYVEGCL